MVVKKGDPVRFLSKRGTKMYGEVLRVGSTKVLIHIRGDPFPVKVEKRRISPIRLRTIQSRSSQQVMERSKPVVTKVKDKPISARTLRIKAKGLGIVGYEEMSLAELTAAVQEAEAEEEPTPVTPRRKSKKSASTSAKAKAKPVKARPVAKAKVSNNGTATNPFRQGSNLWHITEALKKGGQRGKLVKQLHPMVTVYPRIKTGKKYEEHIVYSRILMAGRLLRKQGWNVKVDGRGDDAYMKATPPSANGTRPVKAKGKSRKAKAV